MASIAASRQSQQLTGEPAWEIARLFPNQGQWSVEEYLALPGNHLVEFSHGNVEVLSMPTQSHQNIVAFLYEAILLFARAADLGKVLFAPLHIRLDPSKIREPDIAFMLKANAARRKEEYWEGADWVIEVVSNDDRRRDLEIKRFEYARAGIPEYWIVDPLNSQVIVLSLQQDRYVEIGTFSAGERAESSVLKGLAIDVGQMVASSRD
jgi:Uma2 family endonuclease